VNIQTVPHGEYEAESRIAAAEVDDLQTMNKLYYNPSQLSLFSARWKFEAAAWKRGHRTDKIGDWPLKQVSYSVYRSTRKRFHRNPYTVNKVGDLWALDLVGMGSLASHDGHRYILNAIDTFSKYAYSVPICSKTG